MNEINFKNRTACQWGRIRTAACVFTLIVAGCDKQPHTPAPVPVKVKILQPEEIVVSSLFSGSVEPLQTTSLAFKLPGTVQRLHRPQGLDRDVQVGDVLAKGTVIAELDEGDLRRAKASTEARVAQLEARVATAKDNLQIATRVLERFNNTSGSVSEVARDDAASKRVVAAGELEAAEHALADAKVQLDQANDNYANRQLIVPFDNATVAEKSIEPGERKAAHEVAFKLIDISTVHITFGVPDTMIGDPALRTLDDHVFLGQKLQVTADAFEGRSLVATVTKIAPQADPQSRTFLTELTLPNPQLSDGQRLLRPGMIVTVRVGAKNDRQVLLLPMTAIHRGLSDDDLYVYEATVENDREVVRARKVALGGIYNNQVEVAPTGSDVRTGAKFVVTTAERLADGMFVRVMQESPNDAAALPVFDPEPQTPREAK
ncbi:MAG: efflux RND transporter periplasmic adaptor subunit [Phycisphaeraceae bacterium]|nr:efflux RND transporter periplasmic adaptor subunit [Phycisphaeraceae bacterium]